MNELMNFKETMHYLKTSRATLYRWATEGTIPAIKVGIQWRFNKKRIQEWLDEHVNMRRKKKAKR